MRIRVLLLLTFALQCGGFSKVRLNSKGKPFQIDAFAQLNNQNWSALQIGNTTVKQFQNFKAPPGQNNYLDKSNVVWYQYKFPRKSKVSHVYFQFAPGQNQDDFLDYRLDKIRLSLTFTTIEDIFSWFGDDFEVFKGNSQTSFLERYRVVYKKKGILLNLKGNRASAAIPSKLLALENNELTRQMNDTRYENLGRGQEAWQKLLNPNAIPKKPKQSSYVSYGKIISTDLRRQNVRIHTRYIKSSYLGSILYLRKANKTLAKLEVRRITHTGLTVRLIQGDANKVKKNEKVYRKSKRK